MGTFLRIGSLQSYTCRWLLEQLHLILPPLVTIGWILWAHSLKIKPFKSKPNTNICSCATLPLDPMIVFLQITFTNSTTLQSLIVRISTLLPHERIAFCMWKLFGDCFCGSFGLGSFTEIASIHQFHFASYIIIQLMRVLRKKKKKVIYPLLPSLDPSRSSLVQRVERKVLDFEKKRSGINEVIKWLEKKQSQGEDWCKGHYRIRFA